MKIDEKDSHQSTTRIREHLFWYLLLPGILIAGIALGSHFGNWDLQWLKWIKLLALGIWLTGLIGSFLSRKVDG